MFIIFVHFFAEALYSRYYNPRVLSVLPPVARECTRCICINSKSILFAWVLQKYEGGPQACLVHVIYTACISLNIMIEQIDEQCR